MEESEGGVLALSHHFGLVWLCNLGCHDFGAIQNHTITKYQNWPCVMGSYYLGVAPNRVMQTCLFCRKCAMGTQYVLRYTRQGNKRSEANVCHANVIQHYIFSLIVFVK